MDADGRVTVDGKTYAVDGLGWMDHEFSTSALGPEQVGWDWFSLQLDDGSDLMAFQLRRADGQPDGFSSGSLVAPDGASRTLGPDDFTVTPSGEWRSPHTGGAYPSGWRVTVPSAGLDLTVTPLLADQENRLSFTYWEGAVDVTGTSNGQLVTGRGYVELTGYAGSMQGQF
jgi:predicted secreted hydrolase